jgi:tetratricopeptide (TPR) repeat protein
MANKATSDFNAFDYILKGMSYKDQFRADVLGEAHECFDKAIELDPDSAEAYAWEAWIYLMENYLGNPDDREKTLELAIATAKKSIALDAFSELGHWALAEAYMVLGDRKRALSGLEKASEINPNNPDIVITLGLVHCLDGRINEGIEQIRKAMEFNKHFPEWYYWNQGVAQFAGHR